MHKYSVYTRVYVYVEKILKAKGKLLLRGGIMRKSRNGQRRAFAAFTKFSVLLMCFATVFALVLTAGVFDIGGSDMNEIVDVASAESDSLGSSWNQAVTTNPTTAEIETLQTQLHSTSTKFTWSVGYSTVDFSNYLSADTKNANSNVVIYTNGVGTWGFQYNHGGGFFGSRAQVTAAVNVTIPSVILDLRNRGYSIGVTFTGPHVAQEGTPALILDCTGSCWSDGAATANTHGNVWENMTNDTVGGSTVPGDNSGPLTVESGDTIVNIGFHLNDPFVL